MPTTDKRTLEILIQAPRVPDPKPFSFPQQIKVAEVIEVAKNDPDLKLDPEATYVLATTGVSGQVLDPSRPLVSYGIEDGDTLTIATDSGGV